MALTGNEIRDKFVSYFENKRGHLHLPSSSLIPDNPTLLLTSAGMVQFVPIFLGQAKPTEPPRVVTVQKCARAGGKDSDIENIGRTSRHHSFFEMLGNFSFGDYFKKEVIPWAWEFVTKELGLEPEKLYVTIFQGDEQNPPDDEAFEIWNKVVGVPAERIYRMSRKDNFWGPPGPTGPCGPCSEIYYDRGPDYGPESFDDYCYKGVEGDRYMEFWNLVFMELYKDEEGKFSPLEKKNVDTGSGLERVALILQGKNNTFETDLFFPILEKVSNLAGVPYRGGINNGPWNLSQETKQDSYLKIIADHARAVTFLVSDGIRTSNVGRGYVLRFIIRRAARFGRLLGITEPFIYKLVDEVVKIYGHFYKELVAQKESTVQVIKEEEERFAKTIERGTSLLNDMLGAEGKILAGEDVFNLYATYGFPIELTAEIAQEHGKTVDMDGFAKARAKHEEVSSVGKFNVIITGEEALGKVLKEHGATEFTGYGKLRSEATILAIIGKDGNLLREISEGEEADIILNCTPFYGESGGQLGDTGYLKNEDGILQVLNTKKHEGLHIHRVRSISGVIADGAKVNADVDAGRRKETMLHHSSAHVFHAAVRQIFGKEVVQAGSQVGPAAMRFDFTLSKQPSKAELAQVENLMNTWVRTASPVKTTEMSIDEAKQTGAIAMFGEKYGDRVRVVQMGDFSLEFCGGTHVANTAEIGQIKIISEGSISQGVRRVEALSGEKAWNYISDQLRHLTDATDRLKIKPAELGSQIDRLQDNLKQKEKQLQVLEEKLAVARIPELIAKASKMGETTVVAQAVQDISPASLKSLAENLKNRENLAVLLAAPQPDGGVSLVAAFSPELVKKGLNAGKVASEVAQILGGKGGGRPDIAQAGGKEPEKVSEALNRFNQIVSKLLAV